MRKKGWIWRALLLLAAVVELLGTRSERVARVRPAAPFLLLLGALSSLVAVAPGYRVYALALAEEGIAVAAGTQGLRIVSLW